MTSLRDKHFSKYEVQNNFQGAGDDMRRWVLFSWAKARQDEAAMCWQAGSLAQLLRDLASEGVISILPAIKSVAPHGVDGFEVLDASTFHRYSPLVRSHGEHSEALFQVQTLVPYCPWQRLAAKLNPSVPETDTLNACRTISNGARLSR